MSVITLRLEPTRDGAIALYAKPEVFEGDRPVVVMVHGALRNAAVLRGWIDAFEPDSDLVLAELPGHGRSPPIVPATLEAMAANFGDAITSALAGRKVVLVGESLGGLVGLAVAGLALDPIKAVLAADPPLTAAKLWQVTQSFTRYMAQNPDNGFVRSLAHEIFGLGDGPQVERVYYPLLGQAKTPTHIVTGDIPLLPPRNLAGVACLVDEADRFVIRTFYGDKIQLHLLDQCGHLVLTDQQARCLELIRRIQYEVL